MRLTIVRRWANTVNFVGAMLGLAMPAIATRGQGVGPQDQRWREGTDTHTKQQGLQVLDAGRHDELQACKGRLEVVVQQLVMGKRLG